MKKLILRICLGLACMTLIAVSFAFLSDRGDRWVWVQDAALTPLDGAAYDQFGWSVSVSGDTALVGANCDDDLGDESGSAYIFMRSGSSWSQQAKLMAYDGAGDDQFGSSVSIDGDWALVGAPFDDDQGIDSGSVHVFLRSGTTWAQQAKLVASTGTTKEEFGTSISIDGDTAIIGAPFAGGVHPSAGVAYVFARSGWTWTQQARLSASDGATGDEFGCSVSIDGDTALVGAWGDDDTGDNSGSAYVFCRSGTTWTQQTKLLAADGGGGDYFGTAVAIDGNTALVGAYHDNDPVYESGSAYVFVASGTTWTQQAKLAASGYPGGERFGRSVSLDGDTALIGAYAANSCYVFCRSGFGWSQAARCTDLGAEWLGYSVSLDGDVALAGAPRMGPVSGAALVFVRRPAAWATFRNAGSNPASYVATTLPVLGGTYVGDVDLGGTTGHDLALLVGYATPLTWQLGGGQFLLVNVADATGELLMLSTLPGPIATFSIPIPNDVLLAGYDLSTQAMHLGGVQPFALSNAQDLTLGY